MTALRGFRLTSYSYETDEHVVPVAMAPESFHCPVGHVTTVQFAAEAEEIPATWDCPKCGRVGHRDETAARRIGDTVAGMALVSPRTAATGKTHWDMLLERRSRHELEALLQERLDLLRAGTAG